MASKKIFFVIFLVYLSKVESASLFERSYEYVMNIGKNLAPSFMTMLDCMGEEDAWGCAKTKAGILLDAWGQDLNKQRRSWQGKYFNIFRYFFFVIIYPVNRNTA